MNFYITKSKRQNKKWDLLDGDKTYILSFGDNRYDDYTKHHDEKRKQLYITRHQKREDWTKNGIRTAGWWAKHLLWGEKTIEGSIRDINNRFNINVKLI